MRALIYKAIYDEVIRRTLSLQRIEKLEFIRYAELSRQTGIPANTLQKFFRDYEGHRKSKTLTSLVNHFNIKEEEITKSLSARKIPLNLAQLINNVWDGTEAHAQQIEHLLLASRQIRMEQLKEHR